MLKKSKLRFFSLIKKLMFENYKFVLILLLNKKGLPVGSKPKITSVMPVVKNFT